MAQCWVSFMGEVVLPTPIHKFFPGFVLRRAVTLCCWILVMPFLLTIADCFTIEDRFTQANSSQQGCIFIVYPGFCTSKLMIMWILHQTHKSSFLECKTSFTAIHSEGATVFCILDYHTGPIFYFLWSSDQNTWDPNIFSVYFTYLLQMSLDGWP